LISGGEPMLRPDFPEIFDHITSRSLFYSLNTNGTLITPEIARLLRKKGEKMIALYGATAPVHDRITRTPGSFEALMQGLAYLKEAGAIFTVQITPMKDNHHEFQDMIDLAKSLSPRYRFGAPWLFLSASGDSQKNTTIKRQRLSPEMVVELDKPDVALEESSRTEEDHWYAHETSSDFLLESCVKEKNDFHIDPYGFMTFCCFIKDPALRYDLRSGSVKQCWDEFIPSLADKVKGGEEYRENCGSCSLREDCRWCPAYGFLEHRRYSAKIDYLCSDAKAKRRFKHNWRKNHRRYYKIAGITVQVESLLPITETTFHPKFRLFETKKPGDDIVFMRHYFSLPDLRGKHLGKEVYRKAPWAIYRKENSWIYTNIAANPKDKNIYRLAVFNNQHTKVRIYHPDERIYQKGQLRSLTLFPTDQVMLARVLADRDGCYMHSSGVKLRGKGFLFVGHSEAGKSTMVKMLKSQADILCDDRVILRKHPEGFRIHGTWSHGEIQEVSSSSAPLNSIFFLRKAKECRTVPLEDKKKISRLLLACVIKPFVTVDWWDKTLSIMERIAHEVPCYSLRFDKSGNVVDLLKRL
jgi:MoaA/NifB/PqqE/SkfB family radical SAM enzyme